MVSSLKGVVGLLSVVEGTRRTQAENILIIEPDDDRTPARGRGRLYALIELSGLVAPPPDLRRTLQEIVRREYEYAGGSMSACLEQAILAVNRQLYDFNRDSLREHRQGGGVTFVALRGSDLFIAQAGPAVAYLVQEGRVVRYPHYSPWFDEAFDAGAESSQPRFLGASRHVKADVFHGQIKPGDCFVLAESVLGQIATREQIALALCCGDVEAAADQLADLVGGEDITLAVVEVTDDNDEERVAPPVPAAPVARRFRGEPSRRPEPARRSKIQAKGGRTIKLPAIPLPQIDTRLWAERLRSLLTLIAMLAGRLLAAAFKYARILFLRTLPGNREGEEEVRPRKGRAGGESVKTRVERKLGLSEGSLTLGGPVLKYMAIVIPLLVIVIAGLVYYQRDAVSRGEYAELMQSSRADQEQALAQMADVPQARTLLASALQSVEQASSIRPDEQEAVQLRDEVLTKMDQINQVKRVYWVPELQRYGEPGSQVTRVVVDDINVYVLDRGKNQVYRHTVNETNDGFQDGGSSPVIVKQGEQVGDVVVGELLDMAWVPTGSGRQTSNLVIVDKKGKLFEYSPTFGVKNRPLADSDKWTGPQIVTGYFGNLYVLDSTQNQILKYGPTPGDGGYSSASQKWINDKVKVDLAGATDMVIDGSIYVLFADGKIVKFSGGVQVPFEITGVDVPLNNPQALFTSTDEGTQHLYVADTGNRRVVQLSKEGRFLRQFKVDSDVAAFEDLRGIWVDELEQRMYVLSGKSVFAANLVAD